MFLQPKKFCELRIAGLDLFPGSVSMVSQIVGTFPARGHVDEPSEGIFRMPKPFGTVNRMQIEDRAGIWLLRPRQEALIVALDKAHRAINQLDPILAEIFSNLIEVYVQRLRRKVDDGHELRLLRTRRGEGYVLTAEGQAEHV